MTTAPGEPLAIIAGGGSVPIHVAEAAVAQGRPVLVIGIDGEADKGIERFPHVWLSWGQIGKLQKLLEGHGGARHGADRQHPRAARFQEAQARFRRHQEPAGDPVDHRRRRQRRARRRRSSSSSVAATASSAPTRWRATSSPPHGSIGRHSPGEHGQRDAAIAMRAARAIGAIDAGQAAVAVNGRVVALEAAEGTDAILAAGGRAPRRAAPALGGSRGRPRQVRQTAARTSASTCRQSGRRLSRPSLPPASPALRSRSGG